MEPKPEDEPENGSGVVKSASPRLASKEGSRPLLASPSFRSGEFKVLIQARIGGPKRESELEVRDECIIVRRWIRCDAVPVRHLFCNSRHTWLRSSDARGTRHFDREMKAADEEADVSLLAENAVKQCLKWPHDALFGWSPSITFNADRSSASVEGPWRQRTTSEDPSRTSTESFSCANPENG